MGILSIVAAAITVAVVAGYLIALAMILNRVSARLATLTAAMSELPGKAAPVSEVIDDAGRSLEQARGSLEESVYGHRRVHPGSVATD